MLTLEDLLRKMPFKAGDRRYIFDQYETYKRSKKNLIEIISYEMLKNKFYMQHDTVSKFFEVTYTDELLPTFSPEANLGDCLVYTAFTLDISTLYSLITPVIREHMEKNIYPQDLNRIIMGPELNKAVIKGALPTHQFDFNITNRIRIIYCPSIRGIAVIP